MNDLFVTGRVADVILALMILEAVVLAVHFLKTRRGPSPGQFGYNLAAGACLVLAFRAAITGARWEAIATLLAASGVAHSMDLWRRLRR
jgi:hypothetical protein